ncbi:hypothetical protein D3OALGA1CA_50 [Olavius algarvensis associated proteobacterium Delta 3]|nr:hypothetical protein D3OALGA1CA_50 [Olavius algarvensis associated proteobacterium Delta 3]
MVCTDTSRNDCRKPGCRTGIAGIGFRSERTWVHRYPEALDISDHPRGMPEAEHRP